MNTLLPRLLVALLFGLLSFASAAEAPGENVGASLAESSKAKPFAVTVGMPLELSPLQRLLPQWIVKGFQLDYTFLTFDTVNPGAEIRSLDARHVEVRDGQGWDLLVENDGNGRVGLGSSLLVPPELSGQEVPLRCRPRNLARSTYCVCIPGEDRKLLGQSFTVPSLSPR